MRLWLLFPNGNDIRYQVLIGFDMGGGGPQPTPPTPIEETAADLTYYRQYMYDPITIGAVSALQLVRVSHRPETPEDLLYYRAYIGGI